jgi:hypothetical protein
MKQSTQLLDAQFLLALSAAAARAPKGCRGQSALGTNVLSLGYKLSKGQGAWQAAKHSYQ